MIFEKFIQLKTDRTVAAMIGMSRTKFDQLSLLFSDAYQEVQRERLQRKEIKRLPAGGHRGVFDSDQKRLFFILFYLKTYPTFDVLGFHFDLSAGHAHDAVNEYILILRRALERAKAFPERTFDTPAALQKAIEKYNEISIDGVEIPTVRPSDKTEQTERYSGKKSATP